MTGAATSFAEYPALCLSYVAVMCCIPLKSYIYTQRPSDVAAMRYIPQS